VNLYKQKILLHKLPN